MHRTVFIVVLILAATSLFPLSLAAAPPLASFGLGRSVLAASSSPGNAYLAGASVVVTAPVAGDLSAIGGSVVTAATIRGDELVFAGSVNSRAPVEGDLRAFAGSINIEEAVSGEVIALGFTVRDAGRAEGSTFVAAANAYMTNGSSGPLTIYGNNIALSGDFNGTVNVVSSGRIRLAENTTIRGKFSYEAPEPALIPASAKLIGGVEYTNASYLPDAGTSRILALVSVGFFVFARILGALIVAGLLAGLFPRFAEAIVTYAYVRHPRSILITMLFGFGVLVATPVLLILLSLTFVGIGLALLLFLLYALMAFLAVIYAGILLGSYFARRFGKRETVLWRDGVLGMLALSLLTLVPVVGFFILFLFTVFAAGALVQLFFQFAFPREEVIPLMV
jgi:hypothetical protein